MKKIVIISVLVITALISLTAGYIFAKNYWENHMAWQLYFMTNYVSFTAEFHYQGISIHSNYNDCVNAAMNHLKNINDGSYFCGRECQFHINDDINDDSNAHYEYICTEQTKLIDKEGKFYDNPTYTPSMTDSTAKLEIIPANK